MRLLLLNCVIVLILFSCGERKDITEIRKSYEAIHKAIIEANVIHDTLFGEAITLFSKISSDAYSKIDTRYFEVLLDSAKKANAGQIDIIRKTNEPDIEIRYKERAMKFINLIFDVYHKTFPEFISILNSQSPDRLEKSRKTLYQIEEMTKAMHDCHDAGELIRTKYNF